MAGFAFDILDKIKSFLTGWILDVPAFEFIGIIVGLWSTIIIVRLVMEVIG